MWWFLLRCGRAAVGRAGRARLSARKTCLSTAIEAISRGQSAWNARRLSASINSSSVAPSSSARLRWWAIWSEATRACAEHRFVTVAGPVSDWRQLESSGGDRSQDCPTRCAPHPRAAARGHRGRTVSGQDVEPGRQEDWSGHWDRCRDSSRVREFLVNRGLAGPASGRPGGLLIPAARGRSRRPREPDGHDRSQQRRHPGPHPSVRRPPSLKCRSATRHSPRPTSPCPSVTRSP